MEENGILYVVFIACSLYVHLIAPKSMKILSKSYFFNDCCFKENIQHLHVSFPTLKWELQGELQLSCATVLFCVWVSQCLEITFKQ